MKGNTKKEKRNRKTQAREIKKQKKAREFVENETKSLNPINLSDRLSENGYGKQRQKRRKEKS